MTGVTVLGSTGSVGLSTLDVLRRHPNRFRVVALAANRDVQTLGAQCREFSPRFAVLADPTAAKALREALADMPVPPEVLSGVEGLQWVAALPEAEFVMSAIVGAAGLLPTLAAVQSGKRVLLANKESLVIAGEILMRFAREKGAVLLPIDSEHNAVFQCLPPDFSEGLGRVGVQRILLTASGGPFRDRPLDELAGVTPEEACAHPNWSMGRKISVDSATMMNKGLEVIEACWLFGTTPNRVAVVLHPQSLVHSLVEYVDGSLLAHLGNPDMRTPIAHALGWPERISSGVAALDLFAVGRLDFSPPDRERFPCLDLAFAAAEAGGTAPAVLNAANEVAVDAFLRRRIGFTDIARVVRRTLDQLLAQPATSLEVLLEADRRAREVAEQSLKSLVP